MEVRFLLARQMVDSAYHREYYQRTKEIRQARKRITQKARRAEAYSAIEQYLESHPCVDCSESDRIVLQFDHIKGVKIAAISNMIKNGFSLEKIFIEIEKCEVRCANCHLKKTAKDFNWYGGSNPSG